jgi:hypothetical protein
MVHHMDPSQTWHDLNAAEVVVADAADQPGARPSRAAATAWLPPLPSGARCKRPPMTVSPGAAAAAATEQG